MLSLWYHVNNSLIIKEIQILPKAEATGQAGIWCGNWKVCKIQFASLGAREKKALPKGG